MLLASGQFWDIHLFTQTIPPTSIALATENE